MAKKYSENNTKELFLSILPTQIFACITSSLGGIANGFLIGQYLSNIDMIALGFASPVTQVMTVCSTIVASGARIVCGRFIGRGEQEKINDAFTSAIKMLLIIGAILTCVGLFGSNYIASLVASEEAMIKTSEYFKGISIGIIPTIIIPCLMVFLQMKNCGTYSLISTILLAALNITIGIVSMNNMNVDIFGVGLITSISQYITLLFIVFKFIVQKDLPRLVKSNTRVGKDILLIGLPSALASLLYAFRNSVLNSLASINYGNDAVNALSIMNSSCGPLDAINIGTGQAVLMLASVYIGEKDKDALKSLAKIMIKVGLLLAFLKIAIIIFFTKDIAVVFGAKDNVIPLTYDLYFAYSLAMPLNMIALYFINVYQAFGKVKYCNIILIFTALIFPLSFAFLGQYIIGINSIWYCYVYAEVVTLILIYFVACIKKKHLIKDFDEIICLDKQLEVGNHITISVNSIQEVVEVAKKIQEYCLSENIDSKKSMIAGLCCEEMATNIVEHGFPKSKKKNKSIDIYADVENDLVNIRIKDNAVSFDPHIKLTNNDDPTVNIGIKMVSKLAKEMNYQNSFGFNVLSIVL